MEAKAVVTYVILFLNGLVSQITTYMRSRAGG
jgi:hypothetical protein